ncbi:MAG: PSD1 and planctomycete cytochrome C domain-containing protein [Planctomycetales bacterium]|nr:PSD1 and planctomycete cytochrome C domain-containing protein [Planctomycetales bacterium]
MKRMICLAGMLVASLLPMSSDGCRADEREDFFEAKIRPVLVGTCFRCHGDAKTSGELRIDSLDMLAQGGQSGPAIVPGQPQESLLIKAIKRQADVSAMPPEKDKALRADQIADFVTWIQSGAVWPAKTPKFQTTTHWSFEPIQDVAPPVGQDHVGATSSVDSFIGARQQAQGVHSAPVADKLTRIRRATFDLTGLPPTDAEIQAFERDPSPRAFEAVIDRLLQSAHYGERWGRHWLDVVRYADTAGETADYPVPLAWRYRNYVIDSFNADKPYDEFLQEQIAGDLLAEISRKAVAERDDSESKNDVEQSPTLIARKTSAERYAEQVVGTGYLAISRRFGFDSENYHHLTIQDTIETLGQTVLGLSLGCARCHDHKFDAVSMRDYYALYGIFDSSRYAFPGSEQKNRVRSLLPLIPPHESRPKWREYNARVASVVTSLEQQKQPVSAAILRSMHEIDGDFEMQASAAGGSHGVLVPPWLYHGRIEVNSESQSPFKNVYARGQVGVTVSRGVGEYQITQALYFEPVPHSDNTLHVNLDFRVAAPEAGAEGLHRFWIGMMPAAPAVEVLISAESVSLRSGETIEVLAAVPPFQWQNMQLTLDLKGRTVSGKVGLPGRMTEFTGKRFVPGWSGAMDLVVLEGVDQKETNRPAIWFDNLSVQNASIAPVSTESSSAAGAISCLDPAGLNQAHADLIVEGPFAMAYGMAEGTPHNARMQMRGQPDQAGEEVSRGFIQALGRHALPADTSGSGRLELAQWLTRIDNPLTARVMVNRIWQHHFGRGLVQTPNDFGVRGRPPTHPELLDHLATRFIKSGWSVKMMHRLIMFSATYQQSSVADATQTQATTRPDAGRDFYTRFQRRRLDAEEIRDAILAVSGALDATPGREHPFPSPISWKYTQHSPFSAVYDHNKRSIYLMTQRLKRHPFLSLFDGADPNASTADRLGTTVPAQALFFLNDPFVHTNSEKWATRLQTGNEDHAQQIEQAWRDAVGRTPSEGERNDAREFLLAYRTELISAKMDNVEVRSLAAYLRTLIGSNEFLYVD